MKENKRLNKRPIKLYMMLLFIASSTNIAAQKKPIEYSVEKYSRDSIIVFEDERVDTLYIEDAVELNESYPIDERFNRNAVIFKEVYGKPEFE